MHFPRFHNPGFSTEPEEQRCTSSHVLQDFPAKASPSLSTAPSQTTLSARAFPGGHERAELLVCPFPVPRGSAQGPAALRARRTTPASRPRAVGPAAARRAELSPKQSHLAQRLQGWELKALSLKERLGRGSSGEVKHGKANAVREVFSAGARHPAGTRALPPARDGTWQSLWLQPSVPWCSTESVPPSSASTPGPACTEQGGSFIIFN